MSKFDLSNCEQEPIHIPGKIQSHGCLLAVDAELTIKCCSENAESHLGVSSDVLLNKPIIFLDPYVKGDGAGVMELGKLLPAGDTQYAFEPVNPYPVSIRGMAYNLVVSRSGEYWLFEFEPKVSSLENNIEAQIECSMSGILTSSRLADLLQATSEHVRQIIKYDRVMIYKFHEDGHGEVVAESKTEQLDSWLGLHYPASDIPQQARELYQVNLTRLIADVSQAPSALLTVSGLGSPETMDLTNSVLRAVSPVHIQYLKNMRVASSFSVSILDQDKLWGLIACHNYTPRFINFRQRNAAKLVGQVLSTAVSFRQQEEDQQMAEKLRTASAGIMRHLLRNIPIQEALINEEVTLLDAIPSSGAVIAHDNQLHAVGDVPDKGFLLQFVKWLARNTMSPVFHTDCLSALMPEAVAQKTVASGVLACRLSSYHPEYLIWFRPERVSSVRWAGDPAKQVERGEDGILSISPRVSFEVWCQDVLNTSLPWKKAEIEAAARLTHEVKFAVGRKASEIRLLHNKLQEAYAELDAFSYTVSHDLKNPLTTIKSYSQLLMVRFEIEPRLKQVAERINNSAQKMQLMIEEILNYSKMSQTKIERKPVDMSRMISDLSHDLMVVQNNGNLRIQILETPKVEGDEMMMLQIFSNLLGNAVKYSSKAEHSIVTVNGTITDTGVEYAITDNGIGIKAGEEQFIFNLFSRSKEAEDFEGTGVGLAIVKRMVQKHQGKIWVESAAGKGTTFFVHFPHVNQQRQDLVYA